MTLCLAFPFPICVIVSILIFLSRIAKHSAFLCHTLNKPRTYRRIARIDVADVIFKLVNCLWVIIDKEAEGFAEG